MITIEIENGTNIVLFGRDENGNAYRRVDTNFKPYLYYENIDGNFLTIDGKKASMLQLQNLEDAKVHRDEYQELGKKTYEADVRYVNRYIIDKVDEIKREPIRICYFDIECARTSKGYESVAEANNPILSITCYDNFNSEYLVLVVGKSEKVYDNSFKFFETEEEMANAFLDYVQQKNPDMFIAWNGDGYDFPMIINRIKKLEMRYRKKKLKEGEVKLNLNVNRLGRGGFVNSKGIKGGFSNTAYGRIFLDLMIGYRKMVASGRESWSLDYISKYEGLGGKEVYEGELDDLYKNDIDKFLNYNKRDVELLVLIDKKLRIVDFYDEIRRLSFCTWSDIFMNTRIGDCMCLKYAHNKFVLPTTVKNEYEKYEGAFVHESEPKLHKNIAVMDFRSLYPSIMIGFNVSYETIMKEKTDNCINGFDKFYFKKERGIIPSIVKPLLDMRRDTRKQMKGLDKESSEWKQLDLKQYSLKILANATYGIMGFSNFRLYKRDVAESITFIAQKIIRHTIKWFEEKGFKVVYSDTDSIFIQMNDKSIDYIVELNNFYNEYLIKDFIKNLGVEDEYNIFLLQFEKVYGSVFFKRKEDGTGAKKKYAGRIVWKEGEVVDKMNVMGFESKRSDSPQVGRKFLDELLKMIVYEKPKEEIDTFVADFKHKIRHEFRPEDIALPIGITKELHNYGNQIHARASRYANQEHNAQIEKGDKIKYIYIKPKDVKKCEKDKEENKDKILSCNVIAFKSGKSMPPGYEVDYDTMIKRIVDKKVAILYDGLGWSYQGVNGRVNFKKPTKEERFKQMQLW